MDCYLTTCIPDGIGVILISIFHTFIDVWFGVTARHEDFSEQGDVSDGQSQRVYFREPFLVGKRGHVAAQFLKCRVDAQHPLSLPDVGGVSLHLVRVMRHQATLLMSALVDLVGLVHQGAVQFSTGLQLRRLRVQVREGQLRLGEHRLRPERGPGRQLAAHRAAVKKQRVQLGLELEVGVHLAPEGKVCGSILIEIKKYVLHLKKSLEQWACRS